MEQIVLSFLNGELNVRELSDSTCSQEVEKMFPGTLEMVLTDGKSGRLEVSDVKGNTGQI